MPGRSPVWRQGAWSTLAPAHQAGLLFVAYLALAALSYQLVLQPEGVGVWWAPTGLALAALLSTPRGRWPALLAAIFLAETLSVLSHGRPLYVALSWALSNLLAPGVGAWLLERRLGTPLTLTRVREVLWLFILGCAVAPALGALVSAAAALVWLGAPSFRESWQEWVLSDGLGVLALTPLLLTLRCARPHGAHWAEAAVLLLLLAAVTEWVFGMRVPQPFVVLLPYVVFPLALWAALRFGPLGAASASLLVVTLAVIHTLAGTGPFALVGLPPRQRVWSLQVFLGVLSLSSLTLAAALAERREAEQRQALLVRAGELFAASLDQEVTLGKLTRLLVPDLAEGVAVLLPRNGLPVPVAVAHVEAQQEARLWERLRSHPPTVGPRAGPRPRFERELLVPLSVRGHTMGWLLLQRSASSSAFSPEERRLAEDLARRTAQAVETLRLFRERGEAIAVRDEFLSIAAHELRTPLTSLQLQVQSLSRALQGLPVGTRVVEKLRSMTRQVLRMGRLTEELLDVSRLSAGSFPLHREEMDLADLTREVTARFAEDLQRAGCELRLSTRPAHGRWDRLRIEQVLTNLLSNAIKFGAGHPIEVHVDEAGERARLEVRDHGIGISPEAQSRIFERFARAVPARSYGGLGLGLYVSAQIVEAHGGHIRVTSAPGQGSTFVVELPALEQPQAGLPAESGAEGAEQGPAPASPP